MTDSSWSLFPVCTVRPFILQTACLALWPVRFGASAPQEMDATALRGVKGLHGQTDTPPCQSSNKPFQIPRDQTPGR